MLGDLTSLTSSDLLGQSSFALSALAYLVRDMLALRLLSLFAGVCAFTGNWFAPGGPRKLVLPWLALFLVINVIQVILLLREKRPAAITEEEAELHHAVFPHFSLPEFRKLLRIGTWRTVAAGTIIARRGEVPHEICIIAHGEATADWDGKQFRTMRDGAMIGELALMTDKPISANIRAVSESRCLVWPRNALTNLFARNPLIAIAFHRAFVLSIALTITGRPAQDER